MEGGQTMYADIVVDMFSSSTACCQDSPRHDGLDGNTPSTSAQLPDRSLDARSSRRDAVEEEIRKVWTWVVLGQGTGLASH